MNYDNWRRGITIVPSSASPTSSVFFWRWSAPVSAARAASISCSLAFSFNFIPSLLSLATHRRRSGVLKRSTPEVRGCISMTPRPFARSIPARRIPRSVSDCIPAKVGGRTRSPRPISEASAFLRLPRFGRLSGASMATKSGRSRAHSSIISSSE